MALSLPAIFPEAGREGREPVPPLYAPGISIWFPSLRGPKIRPNRLNRTGFIVADDKPSLADSRAGGREPVPPHDSPGVLQSEHHRVTVLPSLLTQLMVVQLASLPNWMTMSRGQLTLPHEQVKHFCLRSHQIVRSNVSFITSTSSC